MCVQRVCAYVSMCVCARMVCVHIVHTCACVYGAYVCMCVFCAYVCVQCVYVYVRMCVYSDYVFKLCR